MKNTKLYKILKAVYYHLFNTISGFLYRSRYKSFDNSVYQSKKIIIIGPAESSLTYMSGKHIDEYFDIIVRINKSPFTVKKNLDTIGSRTDILYHCLNENPIGGGGPLDFALLQQQNCQYILYPYAETALEANYFSILKKYPTSDIYRINPHFYSHLKRTYQARIPTTGLQALNHLIQSDFKELHITGFTFFKSGYAKGYRDGHQTAEKGRALAESAGNHNADEELRVFKELYNRYAPSKSIHVDKELNNLINTGEL